LYVSFIHDCRKSKISDKLIKIVDEAQYDTFGQEQFDNNKQKKKSKQKIPFLGDHNPAKLPLSN
jgi:hypothetical protein